MNTISICDIITVKEQQPKKNHKPLNKYNKNPKINKVNTLNDKKIKFPSYLYDPKHHNLKIVRKHWKPHLIVK